MKPMSHRERVLTTLALHEPDRVPLDLGGAAYNMTDPVYFQVKQALGITGNIAPYRGGRTSTYYDERILEALGIDFRHIGLSERRGFAPVMRPDGSYTDEWGVGYRSTGLEIATVSHPLADATLDDLEAYSWPDPRAPGRTAGLAERARYLYEKTDYAIVAKPPTSLGVLEWCCALRGTERFLMDLAANKQFARRLAHKVTAVLRGLYETLLDAVAAYAQLVQYATDYGTQKGLFVSPAMYREMLKPYDREIIGFIRERAPKAKVLLHCCGAVYPIIQDFIEIGVDVLNPLQPLAAGMDSARIKAQYGDKLCFHGAIDIQRALAGTPQDVESELRTRLAALAPGGGYIVAPANHIQPDVPGTNVVLLYRLAAALGRYPIRL